VTELPPNTRLILAVHRYIGDPKKYAGELVTVSALEVEGLLHNQLRDAAKRAIMVRDSERHLVLEGMGELLRAIGNDALLRRNAAFSDEPPAPLPDEKPARAMALRLRRPARLAEPPVVRMPYADD
jgi:hypothetical protein